MAPVEDAAPSASVPDWSRENKRPFAWIPARSLLASIRSYQRHGNSRWPWHLLLQKVAVLRHRFWSMITGADIPVNSCISGGLMIPHPNGIVIHPGSEIGPNCMILQQVTIGVADGDRAPRLGGNVLVGSGAKVLGPVRIGDNARIGANAVVLQDVPDGATAVGVPARIITRANARSTP
ncbi:MAG TPA: serine O-acetyltransferase [Steroidobacteraceae bacterium]